MNIYPPAAKRNGEQGRVMVQLTVDKSGGPIACKVVDSSGSASLDARTCELALANARFDPARDANGKPIDSTFKLPGVRWTLKRDSANVDLSEGPISNSRSVEIMVDAQGNGMSCQAIADASGANAGCASFRPGAPVTSPLLIRGRPVAGKVTITTTMRIEPK